MGYLRLRDYVSVIQTPYFNQLIQFTDANRLAKENTALTEMKSYLAVKYDVSTEFADTTVFAYLIKYLANALVELNFPAYDATSAYALNSLVTYNGQEYYNTTSIPSGGEAWNPAHWQLIGDQYDLYYLAYPYPLFEVKTFYNIGDKVYWNGKVYQCLSQSVEIGHFTKLQDQNTNQSTPNVQNFFPGDGSYNSIQQWGTGTVYSVTGVYPNGPAPAAWSAGSYTIGQTVTYNSVIWQCIVATTTATPGADIINWQPITWTFGDNRNGQLVQYMCYMVIWYLSDTLAPRNKPQYWQDNYNTAINWLVMVSQDDKLQADIPLIQPAKGMRIRFGSQTKQTNNYT
ncbi:MAG: hypothetical protein KGI54_17610 [Pseudomonadota bacterium]|nr:hypothetical protein [Pseudomonadota bacterium]